MELHEALSHIAEIRARVAATERFRGYRALPIGSSGVLAVLTALAQPLLISEPASNLSAYLALWLSTAVVAAGTAGSGLLYRRWASDDAAGRELTWLAISQFAPCLAAGALVTVAIARHAPEVAWVLPGVWQVLFSLGIFASCRLLPRAIVWVGVFYLLAGTVNLAFARDAVAFSPWAMGIPFGFGQVATAAVLYWNLEREHGQ
ncbi:hypothetical protein [Fimbriiglobus ruber]|uniref:Uncharacterized protein n=1 Tax=Fimbriiglobus ruber TaxID=1908690 RepID=A0A225DXP5_9BACT|nr:hypothetical protein [Fimbriiglobus ruber]OWK46320.1 hypothetical protein FRUB_00019 [Fimbriiglobus ruber]